MAIARNQLRQIIVDININSVDVTLLNNRSPYEKSSSSLKIVNLYAAYIQSV